MQSIKTKVFIWRTKRTGSTMTKFIRIKLIQV